MEIEQWRIRNYIRTISNFISANEGEGPEADTDLIVPGCEGLHGAAEYLVQLVRVEHAQTGDVVLSNCHVFLSFYKYSQVFTYLKVYLQVTWRWGRPS